MSTKPSNEFFCPISNEIMSDPCMAADGRTYECEMIMKWLQKNDRSPSNNTKLPNKTVIRSINLRNLIRDFLSTNPECYEDVHITTEAKTAETQLDPLCQASNPAQITTIIEKYPQWLFTKLPSTNKFLIELAFEKSDVKIVELILSRITAKYFHVVLQQTTLLKKCTDVVQTACQPERTLKAIQILLYCDQTKFGSVTPSLILQAVQKHAGESIKRSLQSEQLRYQQQLAQAELEMKRRQNQLLATLQSRSVPVTPYGDYSSSYDSGDSNGSDESASEDSDSVEWPDNFYLPAVNAPQRKDYSNCTAANLKNLGNQLKDTHTYTNGQLTPRSHKVFSNIGLNANFDTLEDALSEAPYSSRVGAGKSTDTALMKILRRNFGRHKISVGDLQKIYLLLSYGALLHQPNNDNETALDLIGSLSATNRHLVEAVIAEGGFDQ